MKSFNEFLKQHPAAESLDLPKFSNLLPKDTEKADFLINGGISICEVKQIENIKFPSRVKKLIGQPARNFKRDAYNSINLALRKANGQIEETKKALNLVNAFGIVVLDNRIPNENSVISLIDAADRKMKGGLTVVHAVLCLDILNTFKDSAGNPVYLCQCLHRDTPESKEAAGNCDQLFQDYLKYIGHPGREISMKNLHHEWVFDGQECFNHYEAGFDLL